MKKFTMLFIVATIVSTMFAFKTEAQITTSPVFKITPNPVQNSWLNVVSTDTASIVSGYAMLYDMTGQKLKLQNFTGNYVGMDLWNDRTGRPLDAGMYAIVIQTTNGKKVRWTGKFVKQ